MSTPVTANLHLAGQFLKTSGDAESVSYWSGTKYAPPTGFYQHLVHHCTLESKIETLYKYYPHQKLIKETHEDWHRSQAENYQNAMYTTGFLWFSIYNMARRGYVTRKFSY